MNKRKIFSGYCIAQNCNYSIAVDYIDVGNGKYIKGLVDCEYYGFNQPKVCQDCTICKNVPEQI